MTVFKGRKTGFNPGGANDATPNPSGPSKTKFSGRGSLPEGQLKRYPGPVAEASGGNRRLSKSNHGDGGGSGTTFNGRTAFNRGSK